MTDKTLRAELEELNDEEFYKKVAEIRKESTVLEYAKKRAGIKEVPIGPISKKLVILQGLLNSHGDEPHIRLEAKWLREMVNEINDKVQELLKVMHDD